MIDYRYLESENLTNDERRVLNFYEKEIPGEQRKFWFEEKEIYETFKKRGICSEDEDIKLDSNGFYFTFGFIVLPKQ